MCNVVTAISDICRQFEYGQPTGYLVPYVLYHSNLCTEQLIYTSGLSKLRESAEILAVRYTNLHGIVGVLILET